MRVFVTGASGHLGSAVVPELLRAGHDVVALARSDASAAALASAGVEVRRGDLADLDGLAAAAADADGVIHLAFMNDLITSDYDAAVAADLRAVETLVASLAGTGRPLVVTSGTLMLALIGVTGRAGDEDDAGTDGPRVEAENTTIAAAEHGVRSSVIRLPPVVHSTLDAHGFAHTLVETARRTGVSGYTGDGANRWPAVHTLDAACLYRLALEGAPAGSRLHAVADEGVPFRDLAETIGRGVGVPVARIEDADLFEHFEFLALLVGLDNPTSSTRTRELLGWEPSGPDLLTDLAANYVG